MSTATATAPTKAPPPPAYRPAPPPPRGAAPAQAVQASAWIIKPAEPKPSIPKLVLNATEGWGKSTVGAHAPAPVLLMARGETGYSTLLSVGRVPSIPAILVNSWPELLDGLEGLIANPQGRKTLVLDATGGFERLCHEAVCEREFKGDWGKSGFINFQQGYDTAVPEWLKLLSRLERLNTERGMIILMLGHAKVTTYKNPIGADFDRFTSDVHAKTWGPTFKWADAVFFGNFYSVVDKEKQGKGKGIGGVDRVLYAERRDAFDAKNRYGMRPEILFPAVGTGAVGPEGMWAAIWNEITGQAAAAAT